MALQIKLREAIATYERRTGQRMTYERLASLAGVSRSTIESIATRQTYNATLTTIERICGALECRPGDLLDLDSNAN